MKVANQIANAMGYEYIVLFPRARDALREFTLTGAQFPMPSNICKAAFDAMPGKIVPVNRETGLARNVSVHLYGYRAEETIPPDFTLDPLMTGLSCRGYGQCIISFGRGKMVDAGGGGAFLTNDKPFYQLMKRYSYWPPDLSLPLDRAWSLRHVTWERRWQRMEWWNRMLGDSCVRIPGEQIMPWRCIRRIPGRRDEVVQALRDAGHAVGTNYPPLPGVGDQGAVQWGQEVINFFVNDDYEEKNIANACSLIKRTLDQ